MCGFRLAAVVGLRMMRIKASPTPVCVGGMDLSFLRRRGRRMCQAGQAHSPNQGLSHGLEGNVTHGLEAHATDNAIALICQASDVTE